MDGNEQNVQSGGQGNRPQRSLTSWEGSPTDYIALALNIIGFGLAALAVVLGW